MDKQVFIINGSGGVGKDTFVHLVSVELNNMLKRFHTVDNFSSIDKIKEIAKEIGWDGGKSEKDRKFLSDLKHLASDYCDMPFRTMREKVIQFKNNEENIFLFLHIREPREIERAVAEFHAKAVLVKRDLIGRIVSNDSDKNVFAYGYDYIIDNDGTAEELMEKAKKFVQEVTG